MLWQAQDDAQEVVRGVVLCEEISDERGEPRCLVLSSDREIWMRSAELSVDDSAAASAAALLEQVSALLSIIEQLVSTGEVAEASAAATVLAWFLSDQTADQAHGVDDAQSSEKARAKSRTFEQLSWR